MANPRLPQEIQRTKLVNFRVTSEEFLLLQTRANAISCRGMSDYCRRVVLGEVDTATESPTLLDLQTRLKIVESKLELLAIPTNLSPR